MTVIIHSNGFLSVNSPELIVVGLVGLVLGRVSKVSRVSRVRVTAYCYH